MPPGLSRVKHGAIKAGRGVRFVGRQQSNRAHRVPQRMALNQGGGIGQPAPEAVGQACAYLLGHWTPLTAHRRHSCTRLDTNAVENAIRPSKLGAKNWLFVGHPDAGDRAAVLYSLVISSQRHGHNPHDYLRDVLGRLPAMTTADDLRPLLPANWLPPGTNKS